MEGTVAEQTETATELQMFAGSWCDSIGYSVRVKTGDINLNEFLKAIGVTVNVEGYRATAHSSAASSEADFHLHTSFRVRKGTLEMDAEFVKGGVKRGSEEHEPYAESYLQWFDTFLLVKDLDVRITADFEYPSSDWQSKFPLPLKATVGDGKEIEIDGISFRLADKPADIGKTWITQTKDRILIHLVADRTTKFAAINPRNDIKKFGRVLDTMLEGKNSDKAITARS
jgi:hypothetical protein